MEQNSMNEQNEILYHPIVAVDMIVFTILEDELKVLLVKRGIEPFKGEWAIPGGMLRENESLDEAAKRELTEETGIKTVYLEQLYTFGEPKRDPRGRVISVSYFSLVPASKVEKLRAATDASDARWFSAQQLPDLAFDHRTIIEYAKKRLQWKLEYTNVVYSLLEEEFTLTELQKVYETVFNRKFDKRNFRKKILSLKLIEPTGKTVVRGVQRPAATYKFKNKKLSLVDIA